MNVWFYFFERLSEAYLYSIQLLVCIDEIPIICCMFDLYLSQNIMKDSITIFYADDDHDDIELFTEAIDLIDRPTVLYTHDNGENLLKAVNNPPPTPHIIFLDLNMPGKNGFDVLKELKTSKDHSNIPVVVFSTSSDNTSISKSMALGANFFVTKMGAFKDFKKSIEFALSINWSNFKPANDNFVYRNVV